MHDGSIVLYCPALRLKLGELAGVTELENLSAFLWARRFEKN
jgi:hypothetical protein